MPAYKDSKTGTWFVKFYCKDWTGENKQIKKRGFATKREALDYERNYKIRQENNLDMTFGEFWKLYTEDVKNYVKVVGGMKVAKKVQVHLDTILEELQTLDESDRGIDVEELLVQLKHVLDILQSDEKGGNHYEKDNI